MVEPKVPNRLPPPLEAHLQNPRIKPFLITDQDPFDPRPSGRYLFLEFPRFSAASPGRAASISVSLPQRVTIYEYVGDGCELRQDIRDEERLLRLNEVELPLFTSPLPVDLADGSTVMLPILVDRALLEHVLVKLTP